MIKPLKSCQVPNLTLFLVFAMKIGEIIGERMILGPAFLLLKGREKHLEKISLSVVEMM